MDDFNNLQTLAKRINSSWIGGTPTTRVRGITDLIMSPEAVASIRSMAYNPVNTKVNTGTADKDSTALAAPESLRDELYRNAGINSFMGLNILEFNEMGKGEKFNTLFETAAGSTAYVNFANGGSGTFDGAATQIVVGVDRSRDSLMRVVATDSESGSEMTLLADDQYSVRQNKIGYYGAIEEGRVVLYNRVLCGVIV